jgi:hypothetical protein
VKGSDGTWAGVGTRVLIARMSVSFILHDVLDSGKSVRGLQTGVAAGQAPVPHGRVLVGCHRTRVPLDLRQVPRECTTVLQVSSGVATDRTGVPSVAGMVGPGRLCVLGRRARVAAWLRCVHGCRTARRAGRSRVQAARARVEWRRESVERARPRVKCRRTVVHVR